jgi:hypothetical protein
LDAVVMKTLNEHRTTGINTQEAIQQVNSFEFLHYNHVHSPIYLYFLPLLLDSTYLTDYIRSAGNDAYRTADPTPKGPQPVKVQPIAVPTIPMDEIREVTKGFGDEALIGEGSFGRVYFGVLRNGRSAAVKKLDSSKQPDQELLAQVRVFSLQEFCTLLWYSVSLPITSSGVYGVKA